VERFSLDQFGFSIRRLLYPRKKRSKECSFSKCSINKKGQQPMLPELNPQDLQLTMEQQFTLVRYTQLINEISLEELRANLLETTRQLMVKENVLRSLIKSAI
jgi:Phycobilisome degradation protein nblA